MHRVRGPARRSCDCLALLAYCALRRGRPVRVRHASHRGCNAGGSVAGFVAGFVMSAPAVLSARHEGCRVVGVEGTFCGCTKQSHRGLCNFGVPVQLRSACVTSVGNRDQAVPCHS